MDFNIMIKSLLHLIQTFSNKGDLISHCHMNCFEFHNTLEFTFSVDMWLSLCREYAAGTWPFDACVKLNCSPPQRSAAGKQSSQVQSSGTGVTTVPGNESSRSHQDTDCKRSVNPSPMRSTESSTWQLSVAGTTTKKTNNQKKLRMKVRRWWTCRLRELELTTMHSQITTRVMTFNTQTLCTKTVSGRPSPCLLLVSLSVSKQVKTSVCLSEFQPFPPRLIFLPVNVIGGKQSRLPNATTSR